MKEINEIKSQIGTLEANLWNAKERLKVAHLKHHNLAVGMLVMSQNCNGHDCGMVSVTGWDSSCPEAKVIKKDGNVGLKSAGYLRFWRHLTSEEKATLGETQ